MSDSPGQHPYKKVGIVACAALVIANMIGTGVFTSLGFQVGSLPSPFVLCLLWALGGLVALCGALSYCELAAAFPQSGGEYNFLSKTFHPALGFASGFVSVAVGFAAPIALVAMALSAYLAAAFPHSLSSSVLFAMPFCAVVALAAVHAIAVKASGVFQIVITALKIGMILLFLALGSARGNLADADFAPSPGNLPLFLSPAFAIALMFVLYAYTGWNSVTYILDEVRTPQTTAPRAILFATLLVTLLYVALNALFLRAAPLEAYAGKIGVAGVAAEALFGARGGRLMAALIGGGLLASLSAMTWAGPRVSQAIGRDLHALRLLNRTSPEGIPRTALAVQTALALLFLATGTFETVLVYAQFALVTCSFLTVLGVVVLRKTHPGLERPFRCPLFPLPPLIFLAVTGFALVYTASLKPREAIAGSLTLLAGVFLHSLAARSGKIACSPKKDC